MQRDARALVASWRRGRAELRDGGLHLAPRRGSLPTKLRRAYDWIATRAILSPYEDLHFGPAQRLAAGDHALTLHDAPGYSSFLLLPLLTLVTGRRMVFVGAPGRGKTSVATLMALLAGGELKEVRRAIQHGHPQLTIADLLGSPLPSQLIAAKESEEIRVAWRGWITRRVKIVDEYNRIPTKTQSALLSLMAEGYAEMYEQIVECGPSAWFLTANDDLGGGTFPVIEALRDRVDVVVRCTPFHTQHLGVLAERIASARAAEDLIPSEIVFTAEELDRAAAEVREIAVPPEVLDLLGFFAGQLDFCRRASDRFELMSKDTLRLAGRRVGQVCNEDCPLDKQENICAQTENGVSPRTYQAILHYAMALAYFRGQREVSVEELRQILPWMLLDKLRANPQSAYFHKTEHQILLGDRVTWIQQMFDRAVQQHAAYRPVRQPLLELAARCAAAAPREVAPLTAAVRRAIEELLRKNELNGPVHEDLIRLEHAHATLGRQAGAAV